MQYYDTIAEAYDELHGEEQNNKLKIISKYISPKSGERLLDVGCGTGICSLWSCFSAGIDPSFGLIKQAKKKGNDFIQAKGEYLPFKDHSFDYVISVTAIHLFKDVDKSLKEIKRVGKERFIFSVLKKSSRSEDIIRKIKALFRIRKQINEERDIILIA
jgi:ubiquinone/menaquinone biosynthesis C-methylase UbiE